MQDRSLISIASLLLVLGFIPGTVSAQIVKDRKTKTQSNSYETFKELSDEEKKTQSKSETPKSDRRPRKTEVANEGAGPAGLMNVSANEIAETIRSLNLLIDKNRGGNDLTTLLLNRAMAMFSLARKRLLDSKKNDADETTSRYLKLSLGDADKVIKMAPNRADLVAKAHYIKGLVYVYLDDSARAKEQFQQSLKVQARSENTQWMILYIAEENFENSNFEEAAKYYKAYIARKSKQGMDLAKYKLAWTYLNLKDLQKSRVLFLSLIKEYGDDGFGKDSIRDLAFLESTYSKENLIVKAADKYFKDNEIKKAFLSGVLANFEAKNAVTMQSILVERLLQLETDPVKRVQYMLSGMRTTRKTYASREHLSSYLKIRDAFKKERGTFKKVPENFITSLDLETQYLMKSFVETYSGKVQSSENIPQEELASALKDLFVFYDTYFSSSQRYPNVLLLWWDICDDSNDYVCVDQVALKILKVPSLEAQHVRVAFGRIVAIESQYKVKKDSTALRKSLRESLEFFVNSYPKAESYYQVLARLGEIYSQDKEYPKAIPIFDTLFERDSTTENLYRTLWTRFEAERFEEVARDKRKAKDAEKGESGKITNLKREASLKLAILAKERGDGQAYKTHLLEFMAMNPPPDKAEIARADYYDYLIENVTLNELVDDLVKRDESIRCAGKLADRCLRAWTTALSIPDFSVATKIYPIKALKVGRPSQINYRALLSAILAGDRFHLKKDNFAILDKSILPADREYLISLMSLTESGLALDYFASRAPVRKKIQIEQAALAIRLKTGNWKVPANAFNKKILGPNYKFDKILSGTPSAVKVQASIQIPEGQLKGAALNKASSRLVEQVNQMRTRLKADLKGDYEPESLVEVLTEASQIEESVALFIESQEIPEGLAGADLEVYQKGVAELVDSYRKQAEQWKLAAEKLGERAKGATAAPGEVIASATFPWPGSLTSKKFNPVREAKETKNFLGALLLLDIGRERKVIDDAEYFRARAGILIEAHEGVVSTRYVLSELKEAKQDLLAEELRNAR